jgi:lipopolysaccharide/colanic/teichoic acid biosynthesis glycosyltransferase
MIKRVFDLIAAGVGLLALSPVCLVVGILASLDSRGPILYKADRIGKDGVRFKMYKFRTMVVNADKIGAALTHGTDTRVTRVGRILRKWKIDEIPQLLNVLRGEMSLVGPRPESPGYVEHYTPENRRVLQVRPGITGLTQIKFRHEETLLDKYRNREEIYVKAIMPHKLALDLEYIEKRNFFLDLLLIAQTLLALFLRDNIGEDAANLSIAPTGKED